MSSEIKADKWSPATGTSATLGDSGDTFTIPSGVTLTNSGTASGFGITAANFRPNVAPIIINGDFNVEQRKSASSTGWTSLSGTYVNKDRWKYYITDVGTWTIGGGAAGPTDYGFAKSLWLDNTTPDASLAAASLLAVVQPIEAQNCKIFNWGTSRAEKITVGFWVKATKTGTYIVELLQADSDRICCQSYTVSSTDTWEFKVLNYAADTSGSVNDDNGSGLELRFYLAAGSDYTSGTLATTWAARSNTNRAVGQVNAADADCNWQIAGVQLEVGEYTSSTLPPFQHESFSDNLFRCLRYYQKTYAQGTTPGTATNVGSIFETTNTQQTTYRYYTNSYQREFRAIPTITSYDIDGNSGKLGYATTAGGSITNNQDWFAVVGSFTGTARIGSIASHSYDNYGIQFHYTGDAEL